MFSSKSTPEQTAAPQQRDAKPGDDPRIARGQIPRPERKQSPSVLSADLSVKGNLISEREVMIEGRVEGNLKAKLIQVGENAVIEGQISAEEVVVNGRIKGEIRGNKVRLNNGARVKGDIVHETIAIEAGAHFEGSVKRQENPLAKGPSAASNQGQRRAVNPPLKQPPQQAGRKALA